MKKSLIVLLVAAVSFTAACSKSPSSPEATPAKTETGSTQVDYKKICEHLVAIAPEAKKSELSQSCEAKYRNYLPSCRNAEAVTNCYLNLKSLEERVTCFDSCVREISPAK